MKKSKSSKQKASLQKIRSVIDRLMYDKKAISPSGHTSTQNIFPVAIDEPEGNALKGWIIKEKATKTIEIGLALWHFFTLHL